MVGVPAVSVSLADVAAKVVSSGATRFPGEAIRTAAEWDGGEGGWAQATHVCWVEVDLHTGRVHIPRYLVVEDCGELINPLVVDGQIAGGVVQGIGAVLYEKTVYDDHAQIQTGTFMDYLIPTAMEVPDIEIHHIQTPTSIEANYRGVGEGGMIAAPPAITNDQGLAHRGIARICPAHPRVGEDPPSSTSEVGPPRRAILPSLVRRDPGPTPGARSPPPLCLESSISPNWSCPTATQQPYSAGREQYSGMLG